MKLTPNRKCVTYALKHATILTFLFGILIPQLAASCGVNFDKMKKRRIEAIRGQILSKLGMTQLPNDELPPPNNVPRHIEALYNRTRDFVLEQAREKRVQCDEPEEAYYAQDIVTVYQKNGQQAKQPRTNGELRQRYKGYKIMREISEFFDFNLDHQKLDSDSIVEATLRLYQIQNPGTRGGTREQVELYQLSTPDKAGSDPQKNFLHMKMMDTIGQGWVSFDVTSTVREWVQIPSLNLGLELTIPCPDDEVSTNNKRRESNRGGRKKLDIVFAGSSKERLLQESGRGDRDSETSVPELGKEFNPHLVIMVRTPSSQQIQAHSTSRRRRKRSLDAEFCFQKSTSDTNCCLRELTIDFRKDLEWNWVQAPTSYNANFCAGACPYIWSLDTQHAKILNMYRSMNPRASSAPCCTPKDLEPLTIMYYSNGKYKLTQMTDMVLVSCQCR